MTLSVSVEEKQAGVFIVAPVGSLDSNTYGILEEKLDEILAGEPGILVFDLNGVGYISSAGVRIVLKANRSMERLQGTFSMLNLQPQVEKVFQIIKALPDQQLFSSVEELDRYLDTMQR